MLHSFPDAVNKIYLDFDGQVVRSVHQDFDYIHAPPFDMDGIRHDPQGNVHFSEEEVAHMVSIWERMSEDYRPFAVDVTTEDPSLVDPTIFERDGSGVRVLFTTKFDEGPSGTGLQWYNQPSLGFAQVESFVYEFDAPAWVFSTHPVGAAEIGSHEVGHTLGLEHDGDSSKTGNAGNYRGPHGNGETRWSPIMGQGNVLTQWSDGDYPYATNPQDDVGRIAFALGRRPDDYVAIEPLLTTDDGSVEREGVIGTQGDTDTFSFEIAEPHTVVDIRVEPWHNGPNLDVGLALYGLGSGNVFTYADTGVNPPDRLAASFRVSLEPGTYFLLVDGVGKAPIAGDPGYSDYGSLGYYRITGSIARPPLPGDLNHDGELTSHDIDALYAWMREVPQVSHPEGDLNRDASLDPRDVEFLVRNILLTEFADFNLDGRVDFSDFLVLSTNFGNSQAHWEHGDATGDGVVDLADFLSLSAAFGFAFGRR